MVGCILQGEIQQELQKAERPSLADREYDPDVHCCICRNAPISRVRYPCTHAKYCVNCSLEIARRAMLAGQRPQCPLCRAKVDEVTLGDRVAPSG
jgi:hypothetical protein